MFAWHFWKLTRSSGDSQCPIVLYVSGTPHQNKSLRVSYGSALKTK